MSLNKMYPSASEDAIETQLTRMMCTATDAQSNDEP